MYATYCWVLVALPLTQAAGAGVAVLMTRRARRIVLLALGLMVLGALCLLLVQDFVAGSGFLDLPMRRAFVTTLDQPTGWLRLVLPLAMATILAMWLAAAPRAGLSPRGALLIVVLASAELVVALAPTIWWRDSKVLGSLPSPAVRFLRERLDGRYRMVAVPWFIGYPSTPSLFGLPDIRAIGALPAERYVQYLQTISPSVDWFYMQHAGNVVRHPLLDLGAVRYVVRGLRPEPPLRLEDDPAMPRVYRDERVAIYENAAALPRFRIVHGAVPVRDAREASARLSAAAAAGPHAAAGLVDRIIVEPSADGHLPPEVPAVTAATDEDVTLVDSGDPDRVELVASLARPGWVVLADTFYPGWSATIDGVATPIHPADLLFRAVFVPTGTHRIVFHYDAPAFHIGLALAAIGLALSAFLLARARVGRRPGPP